MRHRSSGNGGCKADRDHHANQCNPNNQAHKDAMDNHANQCSPNNPEYKD